MKNFVFPDDVKIDAIERAKKIFPRVKDALVMAYLTREELNVYHDEGTAQIYISDKYGLLAVVYVYIVATYGLTIRDEIGEFDGNKMSHFIKDAINFDTVEELLEAIKERLV